MSDGLSVEDALTKPVEDMLADKADKPASSNGHISSSTMSSLSPSDDLQRLNEEIERLREERDSFEGQYKGLLAKLTQMRSTLGDRLRQDAEELDRREQQIESLNARTEELDHTVTTLQQELLTSHAEAERVTRELDAQRALATRSTQAEASGLESRSRELQETAERLRMEAEGWESACMEERAAKEDLELRLSQAEIAKEDAERKCEEQQALARSEAESARGLQQVLEEFQVAQESELQRALGDYQAKYDKIADALEEHKERAVTAETKLASLNDAAERCEMFERDVKEKNLLIGKLRHEAVILNEHLTEALRRLRHDASDSNVDRRLVTNLFLQFLSAPRADAKRFEMLKLIASVLKWSDEEREVGGLQKIGGSKSADSGQKIGISAQRARREKPGHERSRPLDGASNEESFSNLFVEFLLSEADKGKDSTKSGHASPTVSQDGAPLSPTLPTSPKSSFRLDSLANLRRPSSDLLGTSRPNPKSP